MPPQSQFASPIQPQEQQKNVHHLTLLKALLFLILIFILLTVLTGYFAYSNTPAAEESNIRSSDLLMPPFPVQPSAPPTQ